MGKRRQACGIIYILNFGKTIKQKPLWVAKSHNQKNTNNHANNKTAGTRYVGEKPSICAPLRDLEAMPKKRLITDRA